MRILPLLLFLALTPFANAQLIDYKADLFSENGFFNSKEVKNKNIKSIRVSKSEKKDGKLFKEEKAAFMYRFYRNGLISSSQKFITLSSRTDTFQLDFYYNANENLYKKIEKQGLFKFNYYFIYNDKAIAQEIKIDANSPDFDTSYIRNYTHQHEKELIITSISNTAGKVFQKLFKEWDYDHRLLREEIRFTRTSNFKITDYEYQLDFLTKKEERSFYGKEVNRHFTFTYKGYELDLIEYFEDDVIKEKFAFLYTDDNLPSAIIERNLSDKSVILYRLSYTYYD